MNFHLYITFFVVRPMRKIVPTILFSVGILFAVTAAAYNLATAQESSQDELQCLEGEVVVIRNNNPTPICVPEDTALRWVQLEIAIIVDYSAEETQETAMEETTEEQDTVEEEQMTEEEQVTEPARKEQSMDIVEEESLYDETFNPRQVEYPNHLGFNDLHIEAINHLIPDDDDSVLNMTVHHHCKLYDDMTAVCLLFPTGMDDQDKPYGIEYVIGADAYAELPDEEKQYWHYHKTELPKVSATLPDLTAEEEEPLIPTLNETYGKVVYFWQIGDKYPMGEPFVVIIQELYE